MGEYVDLREIIRRASGESLDLKTYEADMRHLIDTYIEAREPRKISPFDGMSLLEVINKAGIDTAIAAQLGGLDSNHEAVAETIENNVRRKIIKERLTDPAFYEAMSTLLAEIIESRRLKALVYEDYLKRIAELVARVEAGKTEDTPEELDTAGKLALYNNLKRVAEDDGAYVATADPLETARDIDEVVKQVRPDAWRGVQAKEQVIKAVLYGVLKDPQEVERIFLIVKAQEEY